MITESEASAMLPVVERFLAGEKVDFSLFTSTEQAYGIKANANQTKGVAVVPIKGMITKYDYCGSMGMVSMDRLLKSLANDPTVGAVVLDMDSGGGEASYMSNVAATIRQLREVKPVLGYYSGLCASACFYLGSQTDKLYASSNTDIVGSVGTMIRVVRPNPKAAEQNYIAESVYATKSTEKNQEFEEAFKGNYKLLIENLLDPLNEQFHQDVIKGRPNIDQSILTGKVLTSSKAIGSNMIDGIQSFEAVIEEAYSLIK